MVELSMLIILIALFKAYIDWYTNKEEKGKVKKDVPKNKSWF